VKRESILLTVILPVTVAFVLMLGGWVVTSYFEAVAYNRLTGASATTWDAMFIRFRVVGEATR